MTSEERHEARYRRRKAERQRRRDARSEACGSFEQVFSYEHLYRAGRECCKGVGWKCSTQRYLGNFTANIARTHRELMDGTWKTKGFFAFDLMERGKLRHIRSVHIAERVVQRCLCDNALVPLFSAAFVYDNAASLKGKGIDFAMDRLTCHLQRYYRKHGTDGWALVFDFSDYFNSAPHAPIYAESERRIRDERVQKLACGLMEDFGERGFGLGSQVSQIDALMLPNRLDHFIKEQLHIEGYGRYMDDGYLIHESRDYLQECLKQIRGDMRRPRHPDEREEDAHCKAAGAAFPEDEILSDGDGEGAAEDVPQKRKADAAEAEDLPAMDGGRQNDRGRHPHGIRELARPHAAGQQLPGAAADGQVLQTTDGKRSVKACTRSERTAA